MNPLYWLLDLGWSVAGRIQDHRHRQANLHPSPADLAHRERADRHALERYGDRDAVMRPSPLHAAPVPVRFAQDGSGRSWDQYGQMVDPGHQKGR
jgi:hypothetical protein